MTILKDQYQKAKKEHICDWCNQKIEIGEVYHYGVYKYDYFYTWKNHLRCSEIASKLNMFDHCDEGVTQEDFVELVQETYKNWFYNNNIENFKIPDFKTQLDFVCDKYLS